MDNTKIENRFEGNSFSHQIEKDGLDYLVRIGFSLDEDYKFTHSFRITKSDVNHDTDFRKLINTETELMKTLIEEYIFDIFTIFDIIIKNSTEKNLCMYSAIRNDDKTIRVLTAGSSYEYFLLSKALSLYHDWILYCDLKNRRVRDTLIPNINEILSEIGFI